MLSCTRQRLSRRVRPPPPLFRTLSPRDPDGGRRGAGPAAALAWSPDGTVITVGWARGGLCGWTGGTGCRLFASARAGGDAGFAFDGDDAVADSTSRRPPCLEDGVRALAWGPAGRLFVLQPAPRLVRATPPVTPPASPRAPPPPPAAPCRCLELSLARAVHTRRAGTPAALLADDALWVAAPAVAPTRGAALAPSPPSLAPCRPPPAYLAAAWPLRVASVAPDGATAAVAGGRGVALLTLRTRKWRLFGDAAQEAATVVSSIAWLQRVVVLVGAPPAPALARTPSGAVARAPRGPPPPTLTIYPRFHLDAASKLVERRLPGHPAAIDAAGGHILLAHGGGGGGRGGASADGGAPPPLDVLVLRFDAAGPIEPTTALPACTLTSVRSLSVLGAGPPLADAALVVGRFSSTTAPDTSSDAASTPHHALLTRHGGRAALLDLETGAEAVLARSGVDRVWLPPDDAPRGPVWGCGPAGMRLWLPPDVAAVVDGTLRGTAWADATARAASAPPRTPPLPTDPELEFDPEAHPLAVTPCGDAAIAVRQRVVRRSAAAAGDVHASLPLFLPEIAAQPLLSVVLRHLLVAGDVADAAASVAARAHAPAAAASLEWLVFTSLDASAGAAARVVELESRGASAADLDAARAAAAAARALLHRVAAVLRAHARHADVIISVARKTDAALWPPLFDAAGPPSDLVADEVAAGRLDGGAAALVVVDRVEGAAAAHALALALLKAALDAGRERLAAELLRFIVPPAPCGGLLPPDLGQGRLSGEGGDKHAPPPPSSLWSSLARLVAPPPPPPGAPRGASESTPAAAAAWCCVAAAGHRAVAGRDVRRVAALSDALTAVGASLPALLAAIPCATPRQQSGASVVEALEGVLQGEGGGDGSTAAAALAAATAAGAADWALALALASADGGALGELTDAHSLLWADARRALAQARVPPRVAAAADGAEAARMARLNG